MGKPTFFKTPSGEEMAVMARADYERLVEAAEDLEDARAADEFKRKLASGEEELIPSEIVDRLLDRKESRLRVWREYRGMAAKALAEAAGIAPAYLSQIESGARDGTIATYKKLAAALKVDVDDLI